LAAASSASLDFCLSSCKQCHSTAINSIQCICPRSTESHSQYHPKSRECYDQYYSLDFCFPTCKQCHNMAITSPYITIALLRAKLFCEGSSPDDTDDRDTYCSSSVIGSSLDSHFARRVGFHKTH
jgi:hypothetical protein